MLQKHTIGSFAQPQLQQRMGFKQAMAVAREWQQPHHFVVI